MSFQIRTASLIKILLSFLLMTCFSTVWASPSSQAHPNKDFQAVLSHLVQNGNQITQDYQGHNGSLLMTQAASLYFDHYEGEGMELAVTALSPSQNTRTETAFSQWIGHLGQNASPVQVKDDWQALQSQLRDDLALIQAHQAQSFSTVFFQSFLILLREGFEAILVVTALLTYLKRSPYSQYQPVIYGGVFLALGASILTAFALNTLLKDTAFNSEAMEGLVMLIASAVLFYVSYWLFSKRESERWQHYLRDTMDKAISRGSLWALGFAAFLAVYREGAETILFYQALWGQAGGLSLAIWCGLGSASLALLAVFWLMQTMSLRIPYRFFFTLTAAFLFYMAFYFIGGGLLELQEAGWVAITPINGLPPLTWLGVYPTWESTGAQLAFLAPSLALLLWFKQRQKRSRTLTIPT